MNKLSARDIQVFVAGAFALDGSDALLAIPYYLSYYFSTPSHVLIGMIIPQLVCSLFLPLGIAILMGNARALKLAKICLWLAVVTYSAGIILVCCFRPHDDRSLLSNFVTELVINAILLWLLKHSLSKKLEDNKPQSQPIPLK
ncbi:MAG: hypothetical protein ABSF34_08855 [Verrucomicrobiota bacterium]|jgi:hypothetical protein